MDARRRLVDRLIWLAGVIVLTLRLIVAGIADGPACAPIVAGS